MVIGQGEIWWADLGELIGSGPGLRRPVVVVQCDALNRSRVATVVCVPLTSVLKWADAMGNVRLTAESTGLEKDSVANVSLIVAVDKQQLTECVGRRSRDCLKYVGQAIDEPIDPTMVEKRVSALVVAQGPVEPIGNGVEHQDFVRLAVERKAASQSQLERHVVPRRTPRTAQIVDRNAAGLEQSVDPLEATLAALANLQDTAGRLAKEYEGADQPGEERFVLPVVGNIQEDRLGVRLEHLGLLAGTAGLLLHDGLGGCRFRTRRVHKAKQFLGELRF